MNDVRIDRDELVALTLDLCTIDSAGTAEAGVAEFLVRWLEAEGFGVRRVGLLADRYNVLARWEGEGGGYSLLFNSHMDTAVRSSDTLTTLDPAAAVHHSAWVDGDEIVGEGVVNDKGPMAAFLIAARAVKRSGIKLKGDLLLSAVVAETSHEPVDDPPGALVEWQDLGARFLATHGGVADYVLVAEGTGFSIVSVEAGMAWYKITWRSDQPGFYTPYLPERTTLDQSPNMIVRAAAGIAALEQWAVEYQRKYTVRSGSALVVPKAQVGAIRAGDPSAPKVAPQICHAYLCAFIAPGTDPLALRDEVAQALREAGVAASEIELYVFKPGYEARGAERLIDAVRSAHLEIFGGEPPAPPPPTCSMWRDISSFNELGIPAITYGPRQERHAFRKSLTIESLHRSASVYARTILDLCNQQKMVTISRSASRS